MDKNTKFASKVKDIRERQNMSIEELSEKSGVKIEVLEAMENGEDLEHSLMILRKSVLLL